MSETSPAVRGRPAWTEVVLRYVPRGGMLEDAEWKRRHRLLVWVLALHVPALTAFGLAEGWSPRVVLPVALAIGLITFAAALGERRHPASLLVALGLTSCSVVLVAFSHGSTEAHFHFLVVIGFLALYQDWIPFVTYLALTALIHGLGVALYPGLIFGTHAGETNLWAWSALDELAVLAAVLGVVLVWRFTEDVQTQHADLAHRLAQAEIHRKQFASDLLLNLSRRNQGMFHRQLEIINDLEEKERDPDRLAELFRLDHLATRVRRNAESLLVLSGEQPARMWSEPVGLRDVVRAAIAETEDLQRIVFTVDEQLMVIGSAVSDLTHLLAELVENAVQYSPPTSAVTMQSRPYHPAPGAHLILIEDAGVGMPAKELATSNAILATPRDVDASASRRLGFHVVARLATRHGIEVSLTPTPGCGLTAVVILPAALFAGDSSATSSPILPSVLASPHTDWMVAQRPRAFASPATATPAVGPPPVPTSGRHSWPGSATPADAAPTSPEHDDRPLGAHEFPTGAEPVANGHHTSVAGEPAAIPADGGRGTEGDLGDRAEPPRGRLIHPVVVPPPRDPGSGPQPVAPTSAQSPDEPPAPGARTLTRRVPQSHLAPELVRATPAPDAARPAAIGPPDEGAAGALSRYQVSRRSAQRMIDRSEGPDERPDQEGTTS